MVDTSSNLNRNVLGVPSVQLVNKIGLRLFSSSVINFLISVMCFVPCKAVTYVQKVTSTKISKGYGHMT